MVRPALPLPLVHHLVVLAPRLHPNAQHHPHPPSAAVESPTLLRHRTNHHLAPSATSSPILLSPPTCPHAHLHQHCPRYPHPHLKAKMAVHPQISSVSVLLLPKATNWLMSLSENLQPATTPKSPASGTTAERHSTAYSPSSTTCITSISASTRASTCANGPAASVRANHRHPDSPYSAISEAIPERSLSHVLDLVSLHHPSQNDTL